MSSWPLNGKKGGNRKHSKIDTLPPEMKATVEEMIMDGSATYSDIVAYLEQQGYSLSVSSVCRYAQGYVENLQTLQIAQANFRNMLDELERYPDLDTFTVLSWYEQQGKVARLLCDVCNPDGTPLHFPVDRYFEEGRRTARFLGEDVVKYHRTLTTYLDGLLTGGFELLRVVEPQPPARMLDQPGMRDELRRPMMLLVAARRRPA